MSHIHWQQCTCWLGSLRTGTRIRHLAATNYGLQKSIATGWSIDNKRIYLPYRSLWEMSFNLHIEGCVEVAGKDPLLVGVGLTDMVHQSRGLITCLGGCVSLIFWNPSRCVMLDGSLIGLGRCSSALYGLDALCGYSNLQRPRNTGTRPWRIMAPAAGNNLCIGLLLKT